MQYFVLIIVNAVKLLVMCEVDVKGVREKLRTFRLVF